MIRVFGVFRFIYHTKLVVSDLSSKSFGHPVEYFSFLYSSTLKFFTQVLGQIWMRWEKDVTEPINIFAPKFYRNTNLGFKKKKDYCQM